MNETEKLEWEALQLIIKTLADLDKQTQTRIVAATAVFLGISNQRGE